MWKPTVSICLRGYIDWDPVSSQNSWKKLARQDPSFFLFAVGKEGPWAGQQQRIRLWCEDITTTAGGSLEFLVPLSGCSLGSSLYSSPAWTLPQQPWCAMLAVQCWAEEQLLLSVLWGSHPSACCHWRAEPGPCRAATAAAGQAQPREPCWPGRTGSQLWGALSGNAG